VIARRLFFDTMWYGNTPLSIFLSPLSWLFCAAAVVRRQAYNSGLVRSSRFDVPVIVVGNISVGGTGKTPLVIWLIRFVQKMGLRPGVVSRGYGGLATHWPQQVRPDSDPVAVGDEPVMIARRTGVPVVVSPKRCEAVEALLEYTDCNLVICDDGLQHLALERDIEIAVIDGERRFGNGRCLPSGPLREPVSRLKDVDFVVCNGRPLRGEFGMRYKLYPCINLHDHGRQADLSAFAGRTVHAVSGIGNPNRFFSGLRKAGVKFIPHAFEDHHAYRAEDITFDDGLDVLMTEKDAVKCDRYAQANHWFVPIEAELPEAFNRRLEMLIKRTGNGQKAA